MERKYLTEWKKYLTENTGSEFTQELPDVTIRAPYRVIDLVDSKKGNKIRKQTDMDFVYYYHDSGEIKDPNQKTLARAQSKLQDDQVIDFLYKNRNSSGANRGFGI